MGEDASASRPPDDKKPPAPPKPPVAKKPAFMEAEPWEGDLPAALRERFGEEVLQCASYRGQDFVVATPGAAVPVLEFLKVEHDYDYLVDITAVDYPERAERFDLFYIVYSFASNHRIRIKTAIADGFAPGTACGVHKTANWLEREVFDMFGIRFDGHPDPRRILMPDEWEGHPLRKDYSILRQDERWVKENLGIDSAQ